MRRPHLRAVPAAVMIGAVALLPSAAAGSPLHCNSASLRYPFEPGGPKTFGVLNLRITGGSCNTAHRVARAWMADFELDLKLGRIRLPRRELGFRFTTLRPTEAQTYNERGRRGATTVRFDYRVPNG